MTPIALEYQVGKVIDELVLMYDITDAVVLRTLFLERAPLKMLRDMEKSGTFKEWAPYIKRALKYRQTGIWKALYANKN